MSCFLIPLTQAVATTVVRRHYSRQVFPNDVEKNGRHGNAHAEGLSKTSPWLHHLPKLELLLWGGSLMLVIDHILSGEVTWTYPFFTALTETDGVQVLLRETLTLGIPMSLVPTIIYLFLVFSSSRKIARV